MSVTQSSQRASLVGAGHRAAHRLVLLLRAGGRVRARLASPHINFPFFPLAFFLGWLDGGGQGG